MNEIKSAKNLIDLIATSCYNYSPRPPEYIAKDVIHHLTPRSVELLAIDLRRMAKENDPRRDFSGDTWYRHELLADSHMKHFWDSAEISCHVKNDPECILFDKIRIRIYSDNTNCNLSITLDIFNHLYQPTITSIKINPIGGVVTKMDGKTMEFNIKVKMKDRWVPHFLNMLKYMESLGNAGSSRTVTFYADGDGDFRPKFKWDDRYESMRTDAKDRGEFGALTDDGAGNLLFDAG